MTKPEIDHRIAWWELEANHIRPWHPPRGAPKVARLDTAAALRVRQGVTKPEAIEHLGSSIRE